MVKVDCLSCLTLDLKSQLIIETHFNSKICNYMYVYCPPVIQNQIIIKVIEKIVNYMYFKKLKPMQADVLNKNQI